MPKRTTSKTKPKKKVAKKQVIQHKPKSLVIASPADPNLSIVVASELADDAMIEQDMMGVVAPFWVYKFQQDGKEVVGLSTKGVNEIVRRLGQSAKYNCKIRLNPQYIVKEEKEYDGEKGIEVSVYAEDLITGNSAWGVKFEAYTKKKRDGSTYKNTFAVEKALSKAERNAKKKLISEALAVVMIQQILKGNPDKVKEIAAPQYVEQQVRPVAVPATTTNAQIIADLKKKVDGAKDLATLQTYSENLEKAKMPEEIKKELRGYIQQKSFQF